MDTAFRKDLNSTQRCTLYPQVWTHGNMYLYHELPLLVYPHIASPRPVTMDNQGMLICPFPDNPTFGWKLPDYLWGNRTGYCPHSFEWVYDKELGEMRQQTSPYHDRTDLQHFLFIHHRSFSKEASVSRKFSESPEIIRPSLGSGPTEFVHFLFEIVFFFKILTPFLWSLSQKHCH